MLAIESLLVRRLKLDMRALVDSTLDTVGKTLSSILRVSTSISVLTLNTRNETCVSRNLLRTYVM